MSNNNVIKVSPYDNSYPAKLLVNGIKSKMKLAEDCVSKIYNELIKDSSILAQLQQASIESSKLVVDASQDLIDAIDKGIIKLVTNKDGKCYAQIRNENGQFGKKLFIKKEVFSKGIDPVEMANALQMRALQDQIQEINNQISIIDTNVQEVLQGQQNDRIGLYYSGLSLYLEAKDMRNKDIRNILLAQSLKTLSDATFQLTLELQSDINYLENKEYKNHKGKRIELIDNKIQNITKSFAFIHQSVMLRSGIYCDLGEINAMAAVLADYSMFIENTIAKNAIMLGQLDIDDDGTDKGKWKQRSKFKLDVTQLVEQIDSDEKVVYIDKVKQEVCIHG